jgi:hypothetical protein
MLSALVRLSVIIGVITASGTATAGQRCGSAASESSVDGSRRRAAVNFMVTLNSAQAQWQRDTGRYANLHELRQPAVPFGFVPRLVLDQFGYAVKLVDALDPCGLTLFSDEHGVVYEGYPTAIQATAATDDPRNEGTADEGSGQ